MRSARVADTFGGADAAVGLSTSLRCVAPPVAADAQGEKVALKWDPLECASRQACAVLFDPFADLMKETKPTLSEEDLAQ